MSSECVGSNALCTEQIVSVTSGYNNNGCK